MYRIYIFLISGLLLSSYHAFGQTVDSLSSTMLEYTIDSKVGNNYKTFSLGERGVILLLQSNNIEKGKIQFAFSRLDRNLKRIWQKSFDVDFGTDLIDHALTNDFLYLLVSPKNTEYQILELNLENGSLKSIEYDNIKDYFITEFKVAKNRFFFGGTIKTYPAVIGYNYRTGRKIILSSVNQLKADLVNLEIDDNEEIISVVLFQNNPVSERGLYINRYSFDGKLLTNVFYPTESGYRFLSYRSVILTPYETLFIGTFALKNSDQTYGIYTMKIRGEEVVFLKTYHLAELDYFTKYLREKRQAKIARKVNSLKRSEKELNFQFNTFLQELTFKDNEVIATLDVYDTEFDRSNSAGFFQESTSLGGYGSRRDPSLNRYIRSAYGFREFTPTTIPSERLSPNKPFPTAFEYKTTVVCAFNADGDLIWDNSFPYENDVETIIPMHMTQVIPTEEGLLMGRVVYREEDSEEEVHLKYTPTKIYSDSSTIVPLKPFIKNDRIQYYDYGGFMRWYGTNFLATGIKSVQNTSRREVFFIRKISCIPR